MTGNSQLWVVPESLFLSENRKLADRNSDVPTPTLTNSFVPSVAEVSSNGFSSKPTSDSWPLIPADRSNKGAAASEAGIPGMAESGVIKPNGLYTGQGLGGVSFDLQMKWDKQDASPGRQSFSASQSQHVSPHDIPYSYSANPFPDPLQSSQDDLPQFFPPVSYNWQTPDPTTSNASRSHELLDAFGSGSLPNISPNGLPPGVDNFHQPYAPQIQPYGSGIQGEFEGMVGPHAEIGYPGWVAEVGPFLDDRNAICPGGGQYGEPQGETNISGAMTPQTGNPVQSQMYVRSSMYHPDV